MQALVGGAVEYAGTSFDVVLQAAANGAAVRRFASTGRLPLFALAVAPGRAAGVDAIADLTGTTVGISGLGNGDHALLLYLLDRAGVDASSVRFAAIGTNLFDALRIGQVDAAMVQEPGLGLVVGAGGRELVNFMDIQQATEYLGGLNRRRCRVIEGGASTAGTAVVGPMARPALMRVLDRVPHLGATMERTERR